MTVPGVYSPEQLAAHVDKVIASEGVDDSRAVEMMARAIMNAHCPDQDLWDVVGPNMQEDYRVEARAALGALRALEGE